MRIGFVVNPIAGMGGKVGLKGTDGILDEAIKRKAKIVAVKKAEEFLSHLKNFEIYTASHLMGENECKKVGVTAEVVYKSKIPSNSKDTKNACMEFLKKGVDAIIFVGGDGTARDVYSVVGKKIAILGIPAGVKMYSGVFAINPKAGAEILSSYKIVESEIVDIDENAFRNDELKLKIYGYAITPYKKILLQNGKEILGNDKEMKNEIASFISLICKKSACIIGGGSTTWEIKKTIGINGTFLGVDVVYDGKIIVRDASEEQILNSLNEGKAKIVVSPIGKQGFIFGRGNQQISSNVIKKVGLENIIIVATPDKMQSTPFLYVDTGDKKLNKKLSGWKSVVIGFGLAEKKYIYG